MIVPTKVQGERKLFNESDINSKSQIMKTGQFGGNNSVSDVGNMSEAEAKQMLSEYEFSSARAKKKKLQPKYKISD